MIRIIAAAGFALSVATSAQDATFEFKIPKRPTRKISGDFRLAVRLLNGGDLVQL
jgi:hypothetical protein